MSNGRNSEGYSDPTATNAIGQVSLEENKLDKRANDLIKVLKFIIRSYGFELTARIQIKEVKTGRTYK